jgi:hypothetical protein
MSESRIAKMLGMVKESKSIFYLASVACERMKLSRERERDLVVNCPLSRHLKTNRTRGARYLSF